MIYDKLRNLAYGTLLSLSSFAQQLPAQEIQINSQQTIEQKVNGPNCRSFSSSKGYVYTMPLEEAVQQFPSQEGLTFRKGVELVFREGNSLYYYFYGYSNSKMDWDVAVTARPNGEVASLYYVRDGIRGHSIAKDISELRVTIADLFFWINGYKIPQNPRNIDLNSMRENIKSPTERGSPATYRCNTDNRYGLYLRFNQKTRNTRIIKR